ASGFPVTSGAYDEITNGGLDSYVSKLNSTLTTLSASTFLGGAGTDIGNGFAFDSSGNVYVISSSGSSGFPVTSGAYDESHNGSNDVTISKFNSTLTTLSASTFLGSSGNDGGISIIFDSSGNLYITGNATTGFPTTAGAYQQTYGGGTGDVFISLFSSNLSATPTAQFTATTSSSSEDNATANFQVFLDGPAASLSASVDYAVTGGTATGSGTDYTLASGTLTIVAGQTVGYITISVTDDTAIESNETVVVTLSNPVNA